MPYHLDIICTDSEQSPGERPERFVRVIGEILPYVLAKYSLHDSSDQSAVSPASRSTPNPAGNWKSQNPIDYLSRISRF
jgi:hypothetical protein